MLSLTAAGRHLHFMILLICWCDNLARTGSCNVLGVHILPSMHTYNSPSQYKILETYKSCSHSSSIFLRPDAQLLLTLCV